MCCATRPLVLLKAYELAALTSMAGAISMSAMCTSTMVKQRPSDAVGRDWPYDAGDVTDIPDA